MAQFLLLFLILFVYQHESNGAKILGIFHVPAPSHYSLGKSLMRGLAEAGHDVTIVSSFLDKDPPKGTKYKQIQLTGFEEAIKHKNKELNFFDLKTGGPLMEIIFVNSVGFEMTQKTLEHPNFKGLLNSDEKFDVVIMEQFMNEALKMTAHHFNAPLVLLSTVGPSVWVNHWVANPDLPSYIPDLFTKYSPKMNFWQRLVNSFMNIYHYLVFNLYSLPKHRALAKEYFPNSPVLDEVLYNTSLILLNSHPSMGQPVPTVPNMKSIGGFHLKVPGKLPKDLQNFLDNAKNGVVYFSMGSNLKSAQMPVEKKEAFLKNFGKLKQKVLWKWEDDTLPDQPSNLKIMKWAPQQEILAHPNVILFITHGGLLSTIESIYHGVPVLAIPVFGDQAKNAKNAENYDYGLCLPYDEVNEETIQEKLEELIGNPKYRNNVKLRSKVFNDREMKPLESAVFWIEYVVRHKGASHLMVEGINLRWYQYLLLDVIAFVTFVSFIVFTISWLLIRTLCCRRNNKIEQRRKGSKLKKN